MCGINAFPRQPKTTTTAWLCFIARYIWSVFLHRDDELAWTQLTFTFTFLQFIQPLRLYLDLLLRLNGGCSMFGVSTSLTLILWSFVFASSILFVRVKRLMHKIIFLCFFFFKDSYCMWVEDVFYNNFWIQPFNSTNKSGAINFLLCF